MNRNQRGQHLRLMGFLHYVLWIVIAVTTICLVQVPMRSMADGFISQRTSRAKKVHAESRVAKTQPSHDTQPVTTDPSELPADEAIVEAPPQRKASEQEGKQDDASAATATSEPEIPRRVFASQSTSPSNEEGLAADDAWHPDAPAEGQGETSDSSVASNGSAGTPESPAAAGTGSEQAEDATRTGDVAAVSGLVTEGVVTPSEGSFEPAPTPSTDAVPDESNWANVSGSLPNHSNENAHPNDSNDAVSGRENTSGLLEKLWSDKYASLEALVDSYKSPWPRALESQGTTTETDAQVASEPAVSDNLNGLADGAETSTTESLSTTDTLPTSAPAQGPVSDTQSVASLTNEVAPPANATQAPEVQSSSVPSTAAATSPTEPVSEVEPVLPANTIVPPVVSLEIAIENPAAYRTPLQFLLNDQVVTLAPGKVHTVTPSEKPVVIRYHRGGNQNLEDQQTLHAGRYQFVVRRVGWDLKRLESEGR